MALRGSPTTPYREAGVEVIETTAEIWSRADIIVKVRGPEPGEVEMTRKGQILIGLLIPAQNPDLLETLKSRGVTAIAMEMVPRISRAQKMDALSSMANIAGYRAVIEAANNFGRFYTGADHRRGQGSPRQGSGHRPPAVAGLAAIGAARSLGAIVRAFDVRPEVSEQIESMGAEFLFLDFEESGSGEGGYAAPSSPEFREKQLELFRTQAPEVDIVITTALIPGRDAPKLWLKDMVEAMKPGSVVVDLAAERGGNCDLTVPDQAIETDHGVKIIGYTDFPSRMATQASTLYSTNIRHPDRRPDAGQGRPAGRQHGRRRDPRRHRHPCRRNHLPAAAAQGRRHRQGRAEEGARGKPPCRRPRASRPLCRNRTSARRSCSSWAGCSRC